MLVYDSVTKEIYNPAEKFGRMRINENKCKQGWYADVGIYEYIEPDYSQDTESIGEIVINEGVATKIIIPFPNWLFPSCHCRIWAKKSDCDGRKGGALKEWASDLLQQMYVFSKDSSQGVVKNGEPYYLFYATFLEKDDGFYLKNGIIMNDSPLIGSKIHIEQYTSFSDNGDLIVQDSM